MVIRRDPGGAQRLGLFLLGDQRHLQLGDPVVDADDPVARVAFVGGGSRPGVVDGGVRCPRYGCRCRGWSSPGRRRSVSSR